MFQQGTALKSYSYSGASVLPITTWDGKTDWALLSQEADGRDKDSWDDFGGSRDQGEKHPLVTAAREAWEESVNLLTDPLKKFTEKSLRDYIDLKAGNTKDIVISVDKAMVTYITNFGPDALEQVTKNFYQSLAKATSRHLKEKKALAWVKYDDLKNVIANAPRNQQGALITPIKITANIVNPSNPSRGGQIKNQSISLRPVFVSKLQEYFKGSDYVEGADPKIKFYQRGYSRQPVVTPPIKPTKPIVLPPVTPSKPVGKPGFTLADYPYQQASILPFTSWPDNENQKHFLLSQDTTGDYSGTWSDFTGTKSGTNTAFTTAATGAWNQTFGLIADSQNDIEKLLVSSNRTENIVVSSNKQIVTFITQFYTRFLENVASQFYSTLLKTTGPRLKKAIAWVKYEELEKAMNDAQLNTGGELITPVPVQAIIIKSTDVIIPRQEPKGNYTQIYLNPAFVSKLVQFFKGLPYTPGESSNIMFFSGLNIAAPISKTKPNVMSITSLNFLTSTLNALSSRK